MTPLRAPVRAATIAHADRLFPADLSTRMIARRLYEGVRSLPITCTGAILDLRWLADNASLPDPAQLFILSDDAVRTALLRHGVAADALAPNADPKAIWRVFAEHSHLFRGTPARLRHDHAFSTLFGLSERLTPSTADLYFARISELTATADFLPRTLLTRFNVEMLAVRVQPFDDPKLLTAARDALSKTRLAACYCPDAVTDPERESFSQDLARFGEVTSHDVRTWRGYLEAHRTRRASFKAAGAIATEHHPPTARTCDLSPEVAEQLFGKIVERTFTADEADAFRGQMLTEFARMNMEDGLVMQLLPGASAAQPRSGDGPQANDAAGLVPLLRRFGQEPALTLVLFTQGLPGSDAGRLAVQHRSVVLAPGAGDRSPEELRAFRAWTASTCGYSATLNAPHGCRFVEIAAAADIGRRIDCAYLAELVAAHRLDEDEASDLAKDFASALVKRIYRL